ncbi:MAG: alkaline shock response membrane anchor protein AmaP [Candidatus Omnitrophota bacterium]
MFFLKKLAGLVYFIIMVVSGSVFIAIALDTVSSALLAEIVDNIRGDINARVTLGVVGVIIAGTGFLALVKSRKNRRSDRLITFQNPDGEVTVSISAIENFVQRVARDIPGISDAKAAVKVGKKGIMIRSYVAVSAGTNIPAATENIQLTVKSKVQDMLGVEEKITVTMHITKILKDAEAAVCDDGSDDDKSPAPPFREID